jgi:hypothetical protein
MFLLFRQLAMDLLARIHAAEDDVDRQILSQHFPLFILSFYTNASEQDPESNPFL